MAAEELDPSLLDQNLQDMGAKVGDVNTDDGKEEPASVRDINALPKEDMSSKIQESGESSVRQLQPSTDSVGLEPTVTEKGLLEAAVAGEDHSSVEPEPGTTDNTLSPDNEKIDSSEAPVSVETTEENIQNTIVQQMQIDDDGAATMHEDGVGSTEQAGAVDAPAPPSDIRGDGQTAEEEETDRMGKEVAIKSSQPTDDLNTESGTVPPPPRDEDDAAVAEGTHNTDHANNNPSNAEVNKVLKSLETVKQENISLSSRTQGYKNDGIGFHTAADYDDSVEKAATAAREAAEAHLKRSQRHATTHSSTKPLTRLEHIRALKHKLLPVGSPPTGFGGVGPPSPVLMRDEKGKIFALLPPPPEDISIQDVQGQIQTMARDFQRMKEGPKRGRRNAPPRRRKKLSGPPGSRAQSIPPPANSPSQPPPLSPQQEIQQLEELKGQRESIHKLAASWGIEAPPLEHEKTMLKMREHKTKQGKTLPSRVGAGNRKQSSTTTANDKGAPVPPDEDPLHSVFHRVRTLLQTNLTRVIDMFRSMDSNGDGILEKKEMAMGLKSLGFKLTRGEMTNLWHTFDKDNSGSIEYKELYQILRDSAKTTVDAEAMLDSADMLSKMTAKQRREYEYSLRVQRGKAEADHLRKVARERILKYKASAETERRAKEEEEEAVLTQRTVSSKIDQEASKRARAMARKRIAEKRQKEAAMKEKEEASKARALQEKTVEKQGLAAVGHMRIVKRLNRNLKEHQKESAMEHQDQENVGNTSVQFSIQGKKSSPDKVNDEIKAFKENRKHSELARDTKRRLRKQQMVAVKLREDEKEYQRDKLRMYQMHRNYMEEVGASVGATVVSPIRIPRRRATDASPNKSPVARKDYLYRELRDAPTGQPSPEAIKRAESELGARQRDESLEVLFQQAKRIEAPTFVPGEEISAERVMNLFKEGHTGGPVKKSVSSPVLSTYFDQSKHSKQSKRRGRNPFRNRAPVPIKSIEAYNPRVKEDGPRWEEFKNADSSVSSPLSHHYLSTKGKENSRTYATSQRQTQHRPKKKKSASSMSMLEPLIEPNISLEPIEGDFQNAETNVAAMPSPVDPGLSQLRFANMQPIATGIQTSDAGNYVDIHSVQPNQAAPPGPRVISNVGKQREVSIEERKRFQQLQQMRSEYFGGDENLHNY